MLLRKKNVYLSGNHLRGILFQDLNYPRLTELATPFGDLFLKVAMWTRYFMAVTLRFRSDGVVVYCLQINVLQ